METCWNKMIIIRLKTNQFQIGLRTSDLGLELWGGGGWPYLILLSAKVQIFRLLDFRLRMRVDGWWWWWWVAHFDFIVSQSPNLFFRTSNFGCPNLCFRTSDLGFGLRAWHIALPINYKCFFVLSAETNNVLVAFPYLKFQIWFPSRRGDWKHFYSNG